MAFSLSNHLAQTPHGHPTSAQAIVRISGEIDIATAAELTDYVQQLLDTQGPTTLSLDVADVTFIDSSGLGALVATRNTTDRRGVTLELISPSEPVRRLLELTSLDDVFPVAQASGA